MDEKEFKSTLQSLNPLPCIFEKTILSRNGNCQCSVKYNVAEREIAGCKSREAQMDCLALLNLLRENAVFALRIQGISGRLPHTKAIRLQVGGLRGLKAALLPEQMEDPHIDNIHSLLQQAKGKFGDLHSLPYQQIIKSIAAYKGRRRSSRRKRDP